MKIWVRSGLILLATLGLLLVGQDKLFPPPVGRIPDGVIEHRKATQDEKNYNRKIAKDYASAGFGWKGREWECLLSLWTRESRFDNLPEYQILRGLKYISKRHQTPCKAYNFFLKHNYY